MYHELKLIAALFLAPVLTGQVAESDQGQDPLAGHPIGYWIQQVSSRDWYKAKEALLVLRKVGPQAGAATGAVIRLIRHKKLGADAITTLQHLGEIPKRAVQPLMQALKIRSTCRLSIAALASMGRGARAAKPALNRMVHIPSYRAEVLQALDKIGVDTIALLAKDLKGKRWRRDALERVLALGRQARATAPAVIKVLQFYPRFVPEIGGLRSKAAIIAYEKAKAQFKIRSAKAVQDRILAARILGRMGTPKRALPALKHAANDFNAEVSKAAIWALMVHGSREAVPVLAKALDRTRVRNLNFLIDGLVGFGPAAARELLRLKKLARKPGELGNSAAQAVVAIERSIDLLKGCRSTDAKRRRAASLRVLDFGPAGLAALIAVLQLGDQDLNRAVVKRIVGKPEQYLALGATQVEYPIIPKPRLDPVAFVPLLIEYLNGEDQNLASACCETLAAIGAPHAEHAIPTLHDIVAQTEKGPRLRLAACHAMLALGAMSSLAELRFLSFVPYVKHQDEQIVHQCVQLFAQLGVQAEPCIGPLVELFDGGGEAAANAANVITAIGPIALPELIKSLRAEHGGRRSWCAYTLGKLGPRARDAVVALTRVAADDAAPEVREAATLALAKIKR